MVSIDKVDSFHTNLFTVTNPATEEPAGMISLGGTQDIDRAVAAARRAFLDFSQSSRDDRLSILEAILAGYKTRSREIGDAIREEMGAPTELTQNDQVAVGVSHLSTVLKTFQFEEQHKRFRV